MSNELNNILVSDTIDSCHFNELSNHYSIIKMNSLSDLDSISSLEITCVILDMGQSGAQEAFQELLNRNLHIVTLIASENIHKHRQLVEMGAQDSLSIESLNPKILQHSIELLIARKYIMIIQGT